MEVDYHFIRKRVIGKDALAYADIIDQIANFLAEAVSMK